MPRILYAANNNYNSLIQLSRFMKAMELYPQYKIKVAAYKKSSPIGMQIDWTLDALFSALNVHSNSHTTKGQNIRIYMQQIKSFAPDLVITDMEYFTSFLANELDLPLWQCSSSLITNGLDENEKWTNPSMAFTFHSHTIQKDISYENRTKYLLNISNKKLVYSYYGDLKKPLHLTPEYWWVRPYHQVYKEHIPCQHNITAGLIGANKQILNVLRKYPDTIAFIENCSEKHSDIIVKDLNIEDEYYCNLKNSKVFVNRGQLSFLADAFYNGRFSFIYPYYNDVEAIINSYLSQQIGLSKILLMSDDIMSFAQPEIEKPTYTETIRYLHEHIIEALS